MQLTKVAAPAWSVFSCGTPIFCPRSALTRAAGALAQLKAPDVAPSAPSRRHPANQATSHTGHAAGPDDNAGSPLHLVMQGIVLPGMDRERLKGNLDLLL